MIAPVDASAAAQRHTLIIGQCQVWGSTALIATSFPVGAAIARGIDPAVLTFWRFVFAAIGFTAIVYLTYGLSLPNRRTMLKYAAISLTMAFFFWSMFEALRYTTALNAGTIFVLMPSLSAVYSYFIMGERLNRPKLLALALGAIGAVWVIFRGDIDRLLALDLNIGDFVFFIGCLVMALYTPLLKHFHTGEPAAQVTQWTFTLSCFWLALFTNVKLWHTDYGAVGSDVYVGLVYLVVVTTIISGYLFQAAVLKLGPNRAAAYYYVNPALVVLLDWAIGKGLPPLRTLPGVAIVLAATFVLQLSASKKHAGASKGAA
ncbi:MAG: DMT family transporter [Alphaproteobacteria bacterium]|nr:DMT family transporter [Alphaproteobacteria bacterium]